MAVFHPYTVRCTCGHVFETKLARSVNAGRSPKMRAAILAGTFHRVSCPSCKRESNVEKAFTYADFKTNTFFSVRPRRDRHLFRRVSTELAGSLKRLPKALSPEGERTARVVFGLQELREKLVAQDAGVDDRIIELVKFYLLHEHPFLMHKPRLRLVLHRLHNALYEFIASYDHSPERFVLTVPEAAVMDLVSRRPEMEKLLEERHDTSPFKEAAPWVNVWRYSPQTSALADLKKYAELVRQGGTVDFDSQPFKRMLERLPRGAHLQNWAKQDLLALSKHAKKRERADIQSQLFEVRFGIPLEDDWARNADNDDIDVLWDLLKDLPDSNVEGNTAISALLLEEGEGGGWYNGATHEIGIGEEELSERERFEDVVRHEIGHAVHEQHFATVDAWLKERFGWQRFERTDAGIDAWVGLMGGWGSLTAMERAQVRDVLRKAIGSGEQWGPRPFVKPPPNHPWWKANLGPRLAYEKSGANWFVNHATWLRANGKAFFVNFWYAELMVLDDAASQLVPMMPDSYAAMSPFEFFAELYALYYDLDDPKRGNIPKELWDWMETAIGKPEMNAPKVA